MWESYYHSNFYVVKIPFLSILQQVLNFDFAKCVAFFKLPIFWTSKCRVSKTVKLAIFDYLFFRFNFKQNWMSSWISQFWNNSFLALTSNFETFWSIVEWWWNPTATLGKGLSNWNILIIDEWVQTCKLNCWLSCRQITVLRSLHTLDNSLSSATPPVVTTNLRNLKRCDPLIDYPFPLDENIAIAKVTGGVGRLKIIQKCQNSSINQ